MAGLAEASYKKSESALKEKHVPIRVHPCPSVVRKWPKIRKWPVWGPKIAILGRKWAENEVFRRFFAIFRLRGPLRLVSVDDFLSEA